MSETCFKRCVDNFNGRSLDEEEGRCVEDCANKLIKCNNKLMRTFVTAQGAIMNKRIQEMEQQQQQQASLDNTESDVDRMTAITAVAAGT